MRSVYAIYKHRHSGNRIDMGQIVYTARTRGGANDWVAEQPVEPNIVYRIAQEVEM